MGESTRDPLLQKIWIIRKRKGLNQGDVSQKLGISQTAYSAIENGTNRMYADYLPEIANALDVSVGDLFGNEPGIGPLNKEEIAFVTTLRKVLSPKARKALKEMAEELATPAAKN